MGLAVRVYKNIKETNEEEFDFIAFTLEGFENRVKNLKWNANYKGNCIGCFIQYPYSAHTYFRDILAELIGKKKDFWRDLEKITSLNSKQLQRIIHDDKFPHFDSLIKACQGLLDNTSKPTKPKKRRE